MFSSSQWRTKIVSPNLVVFDEMRIAGFISLIKTGDSRPFLDKLEVFKKIICKNFFSFPYKIKVLTSEEEKKLRIEDIYLIITLFDVQVFRCAIL